MKTVAKKQARLGLRLNEEQKERLERAAALTGQTVSSFFASEVLKRSDEIIARENVRVLSDRCPPLCAHWRPRDDRAGERSSHPGHRHLLKPRLRGGPGDQPFVLDARTFKNTLNRMPETSLGAVDLRGEVPGVSSFEGLWAQGVTLELYGRPVRVSGGSDREEAGGEPAEGSGPRRGD